MFGGEILLVILLLGLLGLLAVVFMAPLVPVRQRALSSFPVVTVGLIGINLFLFLAASQGGEITGDVARAWGLAPRSAGFLTLLTYAFLHGSWLHLFGNMLGLALFGPHVEEALGRLEYFLFYLGCGIAAGLLHLVIEAANGPRAAGVPMVGASGALFGILGLFAVRFYRARIRVSLFAFAPVPAVWALGSFAGLQVIFGVASLTSSRDGDRTAYWAHVGGFLFGVLLALYLRMREDGSREYRLEDAETAAAAGRMDQAAAFYRLSLAEKPDDAATHRALARVCVSLRQGEAAHRHYLDALRLYLRIGQSPAVASLYDEARHVFENFPLSPSLLYRVASACEEAQCYPLALDALSDLCRNFGKAPEAEMALLRMGKLHLKRLDQPGSAAGIFSEFLRLYPASEWQEHVRRLLREARDAQDCDPLPAPQG